MNHILCPVDFSDASINAVEYAVKIGAKSGAYVHLIHVVTPNEYTDRLADDPDDIDHIDDEPSDKLQNLVDEINESAEVQLTSKGVVDGELIDKLEEVIEEKSISLVVMGTEGANSVGEEWMGSNTIKLIEETDVPVLCVPSSASYHQLNHIVYGTDFSPSDKDLLQSVISFSMHWKARISIVHIAKSSSALTNEGYRGYVEEMKSYFANDELAFEEFITEDEPQIALVHILNEYKGDLLVLVHKKRNFLQSIFHKSLTKRMSYMTNFPLLVFKG